MKEKALLAEILRFLLAESIFEREERMKYYFYAREVEREKQKIEKLKEFLERLDEE